MLKKIRGKWYILNHTGTKKLSKGYPDTTKGYNQAKERLRVIEFFGHKK